MERQSNYPIRALDHAFQILETVYEMNGAGIAELVERLDLSKSSIHSHLTTLEQLGYVSNTDGVYEIGLGFLTFGGRARDQNSFFQIATDAADELAETTGELAAVSQEFRGQNLYLYQVTGENAMALDSHLGSRLPLHCTATGKAILSALPRERVDEIVEGRGLPKATSNTITERGALYEELEQIATRGVSFDDEERIEGMRGIAAPVVHQEREKVLGAIAVTGPTSRISGQRFEEDLPDVVARIGRMVEINATYS